MKNPFKKGMCPRPFTTDSGLKWNTLEQTSAINEVSAPEMRMILDAIEKGCDYKIPAVALDTFIGFALASRDHNWIERLRLRPDGYVSGYLFYEIRLVGAAAPRVAPARPKPWGQADFDKATDYKFSDVDLDTSADDLTIPLWSEEDEAAYWAHEEDNDMAMLDKHLD